jgi:hypothetical protein
MIRPRLIASAIALALAPAAASAQYATWTNRSAFLAASGASLQATFDARPNGPQGTFTEGTINFSGYGGSQLWVTTPGSFAWFRDIAPRPATNVLTGNGPDDILMSLAGPSLGIGFDVITNLWASPTVTLFDGGGVAMTTFTLGQAPNTQGFFGVTSAIPFFAVRFASVNGGTQDSAIDDVVVADASISTVPEPGTWALVATGLVALVARRRRASDRR